MLQFTPILLILLFLPLAIWGEKIAFKMRPVYNYIFFGGVCIFFIVSAYLQPELLYKNLLWAFFSLMFMSVYHAKRKSRDGNPSNSTT